MKLLSIIIPTFRSEAFLEQTVRELIEHLAPDPRFEIVLVNDGSPDGVQRLIEQLAAQDERIRFVELAKNRGQHRATLAGMRAARGDVVVTMDDDGQNPPSAVLRVVEALETRGLDLVYGRFLSIEQPLSRIFISRLNRAVARFILGNSGGYYVSQVRAIRGDLARAIATKDTQALLLEPLFFEATRHIGDVPVEHRPRKQGQSSYNLVRLFQLWLALILTQPQLVVRTAAAASFLAGAVAFVTSLLGVARVPMAAMAAALCFLSLGVAAIGVFVGRLYVLRGTDWVRSTSETRTAAVAEHPGDSSRQQKAV